MTAKTAAAKVRKAVARETEVWKLTAGDLAASLRPTAADLAEALGLTKNR
jgi:hypothetical protein